MKRFWTGDDHLGHVNILKYTARPWDTVEEMNEALIENWNATVPSDGIVNIVGDLLLGHAEETLKLIPRLNGRKRLYAGNHDRPFKDNKPSYIERWTPRYEEAGIEIVSHGEPVVETLGGHDVQVSHFPYERDERHGDRYAEHYPIDDGRWLVHGHVHEAWQVRGRQINVGVDAWDYTPVPEDLLIYIIEHGGTHDDAT